MSNTAASVLEQARKDIGYSRWNDPQQGTKFGRYFRDVLKWGSYYGENGVPYCGMAVSYWFAMAGATCPGIPGAYTPTMAQQGKNAGKAVDKYKADPGDVVYFDWELDGVIDHVGIVEYNNGSYLTTIEGNTNNGQVARRTRAMNTIVCVIRPNYDGASGSSTPSTPSTSKPSTSTSGSDLVKMGQSYLKKFNYDIGSTGVDGSYGPATKKGLVKYVQYNMNYYGAGLAVDGIAGPATKAAWNKYGPVKLGSTRIYLVKAVQIGLCLNGISVGSSGIDGSCGPDTVDAIKRFQTNKGLSVDGIFGPASFAAMFA